MKAGVLTAFIVLLVAEVSGAKTLLPDSGAPVEAITSLDQVEQVVRDTQWQFWQVVPPSVDNPFYLHPECVVRTVDWSSGAWPKKFLKQMYAQMKLVGSGDYPIYFLTVVEERSGDIVYYNAYDQEVWRTPAPKDYNPYLFALLKYGAESETELSAQQKWYGRSSNVGTTLILLPSSFVSLYTADAASDTSALLLSTESVETASASLMMTTLSVPEVPGGSTNTTGTATNLPAGPVTLYFTVPESFGSEAEIFRKDNLRAARWTVATNRMAVTVVSNQVAWTNTESISGDVGFYILSDIGVDSDQDGYSDGRECYVTNTNPNLFNYADSDSDGLHDWYEVMMYGSITNQNGTDDFDGDGLQNAAELELSTTNVVFHSDPTRPDTDGGGIDDGFETTNTVYGLDPLDPADDTADLDYDGRNNFEEYQLGTDLDNADTDGDGISDGMEVEWSGIADTNGVPANPLVVNAWDWLSDSDGDGLTLAEEYAYGTDPANSTDGDQTNGVVDVLLTVGETYSGIYNYVNWAYELKLSGQRTVSLASEYGDFHSPPSELFKLRKGTSYNVTLTRMDGAWSPYDYDFYEFVSLISGPCLFWDESDDPLGIIGIHDADAQYMTMLFTDFGLRSYLDPVPLTAKVHIVDADLDIEGLDDDLEESQGKILAVGEQAALTLALAPDGLPDNTSVELVASDASAIRIFDDRGIEVIGPTKSTSWDCSLDTCCLPGEDLIFTAKGVDLGEPTISLIYKDADGDEVCRDTVKLAVVQIMVVSMDFKDSVDASGADEDNNFDIVDDELNPIAEGRGPEWTTNEANNVETIYIRNRKVRADATFRIDPPVSGPVSVELYSTGDLDFTADGTDNHTTTLAFDSTGLCTKTFTTHEKTVASVLDRKKYTINWQGCAAGNTVDQYIYTLYGVPVDRYPNVEGHQTKDVLQMHLQYLLGPSPPIDTGKWCNGTSTLNKEGDDSIPHAVFAGIILDGDFLAGDEVPDPWEVVIDKGPCEGYADLMRESLLVIGASSDKIDRKSVVSYPVYRPSWLGGGDKKIIKAWLALSGDGPYLNEGVCGVITDDHGMKYYDVADGIIGSGDWANPDVLGDNNLWFEPTESVSGTVMKEFVDELYGYWGNASLPMYDEAYQDYAQQIAIDDIVDSVGDSYTINYRTEGVKDVGVLVEVLLFKAGTSSWDCVATNRNVIQQEWENEQSATFSITNAGTYTVTAKILEGNDECKCDTWIDAVGPQWSR